MLCVRVILSKVRYRNLLFPKAEVNNIAGTVTHEFEGE